MSISVFRNVHNAIFISQTKTGTKGHVVKLILNTMSEFNLNLKSALEFMDLLVIKITITRYPM